MTKRVVVTGATGFIGRAVVPQLLERGFEVYALGRDPSNRAILNQSNVSFLEADLLVPHEVEAHLARLRPSHLLHLAWYAEPGLYWRSPKNLEWVAASLHLIRAFGAAGGRRAVVAGTCAEYAWGPPSFHEMHSRCEPATLYGSAKDGLRRILHAYAAGSDLSLAWGRIFFVYGPGEKSGRLVSDAIQHFLARKRFPTSEGLQKRDFLHVVDVAGAFATLLAGDVEGPVNIGSGKAVSVRSLLETLAAQLECFELLAFGDIAPSLQDPSVIEADVRRLNQEIGFRPCFDLEEGLRDTVTWWKSQRNQDSLVSDRKRLSTR